MKKTVSLLLTLCIFLSICPFVAFSEDIPKESIVYIDIETWKTLPKRQVYSGLAETIKHACLASADFFE